MSAIVLVLACAGGRDPGEPEGTMSPGADPPEVCDVDGDGALGCGGPDCDDGDPQVFPGADDGADRVTSTEVAPGFAVVQRFTDGKVRFAVGGNEGLAYGEERGDDFEIEIVSPGYQYYVSMAEDGDGQPHLAWGHPFGGAFHAWKQDGAWQVETVDADAIPDLGTTLAVDPAGGVHLAFKDNASGYVVYETNAGGAWARVELPESTLWGGYPAIDVDADGVVHLVYVTQQGDLRLLTNDRGGWTAETLRDDVSGPTRISVDDDALRVAYVVPPWREGAGAGLLTSDGGGWTDEPLVTGDVEAVAIGRSAAGPLAGYLVRGPDDQLSIHARAGDGPVVSRTLDWDEPGFSGAALAFDDAGLALVVSNPRWMDGGGDGVRVRELSLPDGADQDCDGLADGRPDLADVDAVCAWAEDLFASAPATCAPVLPAEDCPAQAATFPTADAFADCALAVGQGQCDWTALPAACATRPALDPALPVASLSDADGRALCAWTAVTLGGEDRVYECSDGTTTISTVAECEAGLPLFSGCGLTVDDHAACTLALARDPCGGLADYVCEPFLACLADLYSF